MKDYDKLSDKEKQAYNKIVTLKLVVGDAEGILELLSWSKSTAGYLAELESVKGTPGGEVKLKTYAQLANDLIEFIIKNISIGEPDYDKIN